MDFLLHDPQIGEEMRLIEAKLLRSAHSREPVTRQAVEELIRGGGKRLRPLMLLLSAKNGEYDKEEICSVAAALEIVHMATLVHDDIIDDSVLRRGSETVQSKWGKDIAVFTGDYLLCTFFLLIPPRYRIRDLQKWMRVIKTVCEGEIRQYHDRYKPDITVRGYLKRIAAKTAVLFSLNCYVGASCAKCGQQIVHALSKFGMNMGMAFQITDDILDFTGKSSEMGKPASNDFTQGVYTLPIIYALRHSEYGEKLRNMLSKRQYTKDEEDQITHMVFQAGGIGYAKKLARQYVERARKHVNGLPAGASRNAMNALLEQVANRVV